MPSSSSQADRATRWQQVFSSCLQESERASSLKAAALAGKLGEWTALLTAAVVEACQRVGWTAAAKGFPSSLLPQGRQEYLGLDVMAFEPYHGIGTERWPFPVAVFELENSIQDDRVAYSLWKVMCIRCSLRVVFAYRDDWVQGRELIARLTRDIVTPIPLTTRSDFLGQTLVIVGSRGEGETFPWSYFKFWELDINLGQFEKR